MSALPLPFTPATRQFTMRGRLTRGQRRALEDLWPRYGVQAREAPLSWAELFGRRAPVCMEIGFGMGDTLAQMAAARPERDFAGVDLYLPGIGGTLKKLQECELGNVRLIYGDAAAVLAVAVPPSSLEELYIFFPDPWPKKRHHKRRLIQPPFVALAARCLVPGGRLFLATDWEDYAGEMLGALAGSPLLQNLSRDGGFAPRHAARPPTKFEQRGQRLGHAVWDLAFERRSNSPP